LFKDFQKLVSGAQSVGSDMDASREAWTERLTSPPVSSL